MGQEALVVTDAPSYVGRFAPSTTGPAHPGTLLAALLCWLDARSRGGRVELRLEDLDPERCKPAFAEAMHTDLAWLGLDWDAVVLQSTNTERHERALDRLAEAGVLYPCSCARSEIRARGRRAPDGSWRYDGRCRATPLPARAAGGWRASDAALRVRVRNRVIELADASGSALSGNPARDYGDPVVRRRDGAIAYHLASVVDDAGAGITHVVRGRDLAPSTLVQVALQDLLGLPRPAYRHHLLLLEPRGRKLAKFHSAVAAEILRTRYSPASLCGFLASEAGLCAPLDRAAPAELLARFDWSRVREEDRAIEWTGTELRSLGAEHEVTPR